jgi:hypothetical protein
MENIVRDIPTILKEMHIIVSIIIVIPHVVVILGTLPMIGIIIFLTET